MSWGGGLREKDGLACVLERDKRAGVIPTSRGLLVGDGAAWSCTPLGLCVSTCMRRAAV